MAGIGLRHLHMPALAQKDAPAAAWLEIHSENFLCDGGPRLAMLDAIVARTPMSCHGVGLSLASAEGLDAAHLRRLKTLFARVNPGLISEHLAWSVTNGVYLNDLLPFPYNQETLNIVSRNVDQAQNAFGRRILVENPSGYLQFPDSTLREADFLNTLAARTGCGVLLDLNNVFITCTNTGGDARAYIDAVTAETIGEIHLAGHSLRGDGAEAFLVDTHAAQVADPVWDLYTHAIDRLGARPTLIEWDLDLPAWAVLLAEAHKAQTILNRAEAAADAR